MGDTENPDVEGQENDPPQDPEWLKNLRRDNERLKKENDSFKETLATRDRIALFDKVGIPAEGPGAMFREGYKGDLTEEAVKAKALEYQLIQAERTTPTEEREVFDRIDDSLAGATGSQDRLLPRDREQQLVEQIRNAESGDEVEAILDAAGLLIEHDR